jgi:hypothetical protein
MRAARALAWARPPAGAARGSFPSYGGGGGGQKPLLARAVPRVHLAAGYSSGGGGGAPRDKSDCRFRKTATDYDRKPGIKRLSCTAK